MRTDTEILERIEARNSYDWLGTEFSDLVCRLPFDLAKPLLATPDEAAWKVIPRDRESVLKEMLEYMPFAWDKANGERGVSAGRSMSHYMAWTWLIGDDFGELTSYQFYGKDHLVRICERYGWDHRQWDDGFRNN